MALSSSNSTKLFLPVSFLFPLFFLSFLGNDHMLHQTPKKPTPLISASTKYNKSSAQVLLFPIFVSLQTCNLHCFLRRLKAHAWDARRGDHTSAPCSIGKGGVMCVPCARRKAMRGRCLTYLRPRICKWLATTYSSSSTVGASPILLLLYCFC